MVFGLPFINSPDEVRQTHVLRRKRRDPFCIGNHGELKSFSS